MARIMTIGRHFKVSVLGYELEQKLVTGGFQTEVSSLAKVFLHSLSSCGRNPPHAWRNIFDSPRSSQHAITSIPLTNR